MKQVLVYLLVANLLLAGFLPAAEASEAYWQGSTPGLSVSADAAVLMDARTGQVLFAKNPFKKRPPASTTKIITALLAIETGKLGDMVTVSRRAAYTEGSSMYLRQGEQFTLSDLLYGALLNSGNDACVAIAEHIAGSVEKFAVLMNVKALAIGAVNTHFVNPNGLPDQDHYTCAYDLALIARQGLKNKTFSSIVSTRSKTVDPAGDGWVRRLTNTNQLLWSYLWAEGVKTGTTSAAGPCLVSAASKDNRQLVAVVLRSGDRWGDSKRMLEYGFNNFEFSQVAVRGARYGSVMVANGIPGEVPLTYAGDLGILVPEDDRQALQKRTNIDAGMSAPVRKGQVIGSVNYFVNGCSVGRVDLMAAQEVREVGFWDRVIRWWQNLLVNIFGQITT